MRKTSMGRGCGFPFIAIAILYKCNAEVLQFSQFTKTKILKNTCDDSRRISTSKVTRQADCWISCTQDPQCRRFIYCAADFSCNLYEDGNECVMSDDSASCSCFRKDIGRISSLIITCRLGYYGENCQTIVKDCKEATQRPLNTTSPSALVHIKPLASPQPFEVRCNLRQGGRTQILKRGISCVPESFNRSLAEYAEGFGEVSHNRWLGFKNILAIINNNSTLKYFLQLVLVRSRWTVCMAYYEIIKLGNQSQGYILSLHFRPPVNKNCGDSITGTLDLSERSFSTYDVDYTGSNGCPKRFGGGWWFANNSECTRSFLFGTMDGESATDNIWLDDLAGKLFVQVNVWLY